MARAKCFRLILLVCTFSSFVFPGMPSPAGYRTALRLFQLAERFGLPVVTLVDTCGAWPSFEVGLCLYATARGAPCAFSSFGLRNSLVFARFWAGSACPYYVKRTHRNKTNSNQIPPIMQAERDGQSEAIATNLTVMAGLKVPIVTLIMGEGGSGGALGVGMGNRVGMLSRAYFGVVSGKRNRVFGWDRFWHLSA